MGGSVDTEVITLSDDAVTCGALPSCGCTSLSSGCNLTVAISRNGAHDGTATASPSQLYCFAPTVISGIDPSAGPLDGGTSITVFGSFLPGGAHCRIGERLVEATASTTSLLCAPAPPLVTSSYEAARSQPVRVSLNGQDFSPSLAAAPAFTYYETPYIQHIKPAAGPVHGGTAITVNGLRLNAGGWAGRADVMVRLGANSSTHVLNITALDASAVGAWLVTSGIGSASASCLQLCCIVASSGDAVQPCSGPETDGACAVCRVPLHLALNRMDFQETTSTHPAQPSPAQPEPMQLSPV